MAWLYVHVVLILILLFLATCSVRRGGVVVVRGNPMTLLILLYLVSAVASLFVTQDYLPAFAFASHDFATYVVYSGLIVASLLPTLALKGYKVETIRLLGLPYASIVLHILALLIWFSLLYHLPYVVEALGRGAVSVRTGLNVDGESVLPATPATTLAVGVASFYQIFIFVFFACLIERGGRFLTVSMAVGGFLYVVSSLTFTARDGPLFLLLAGSFAYSIFRGELSAKQRRAIKTSGFGAAALAIVAFFGFTIQRFGDDGAIRILYGTVGYIGQQPYVFAETVRSQVHFYGLELRLPLIANLIGEGREIIRRDVFEWSFGTFLKDYYSMYGWVSVLALVIVPTYLFVLAFRKWRRPHQTVTFLLLMSLYFQLMSSGIFYFRLGTRGGNMYLLLVVVLYGALALSTNRKSVRVQKGAEVAR